MPQAIENDAATVATADGRWVLLRRLSVDNLLLIIPILGAIAAGLWEGGQIQATMQSGIAQEREAREQWAHSEADMRESQNKALSDKLAQIAADVRELRSFVMVKKEFR